jgi:Raf kinase inhibitor-like YbhB/YbcL family protein
MRSTLFLAVLFAAISSCPAAAGEAASMLTLTSSAFAVGQPIPKKYTCEGDDRSPPLAWTGAPAGTKSYALIVDDPDAPDPNAPRMTWVHWVLYNVPAATTTLGEGSSSGALPQGAIQGHNDFGRIHFGGPCPPIGRHRYFHKLYALDAMLPADKALDKAGLESAMKGHVLAQAELMGTYQKGDK